MINDGGPAYPRSSFLGPNGELEAKAQDGMSLRDYFAASVIQGIYANRDFTHENQERMARVAYAMADAMLAARKEST